MRPEFRGTDPDGGAYSVELSLTKKAQQFPNEGNKNKGIKCYAQYSDFICCTGLLEQLGR